ncbi:hypothetical protein L917_11522 [Phytophthora nicotianae]|uniref:Uncharacterized protein n=1 Tax=Phytophthora nicotianae TaxID=4792 RepID=W2KY92_PHYNI|nr:hypothetical protein L917_11522 [Phytophthora nicotianae]
MHVEDIQATKPLLMGVLMALKCFPVQQAKKQVLTYAGYHHSAHLLFFANKILSTIPKVFKTLPSSAKAHYRKFIDQIHIKYKGEHEVLQCDLTLWHLW